MTLKISTFKTNVESEQEGVWVDIGSGARIKVARMNNFAYEDEIRRLGKPHLRAIRLGTLENETLEKITIKAFSLHILKDWDGIDDDEGEPIPFSSAKAEELMTDYRDFYRMVQEFANEQDLYRKAEQEDAEGNSGSASLGT